MPEPSFVPAPRNGLRRVARLPDARTFPAPAVKPGEYEPGWCSGVRRFEDPRGEFGVLCCASSDEAAVGDDISQYRVRKVKGRGLLEWIGDFVGIGPDPGEARPGEIAGSYRDGRVVVPLR